MLRGDVLLLALAGVILVPMIRLAEDLLVLLRAIGDEVVGVAALEAS
ncbi:hypothetical protein BAP_4047 [Bacillus sp. CN2]|nr:hypothetical protein BAP_4047 [Bacillus sp. CN2]